MLDEETKSYFWTLVDKQGVGECWNWNGKRMPLKNSKKPGYGTFSANGKTCVAHRYAYQALVGRIPDGLVLDHTCRNHGCVNPAHLEPVTNKENILRGTAPPAKNAAKTHCKHGHPLIGENIKRRVRVFGNSVTIERSCLACRKLRKSWEGDKGKLRKAAYYSNFVPHERVGHDK